MSESGQNVKKKNTDECLVCSKPPYQSKKISSKLLDFSIKDLLLKYGGISKDKGVICRNCERRLETLHKKTVEFYDECQSAARKDDFTTPVVCNKRLPSSPLVGFHPKRASLEINEDFQQPSQHASSENMFVDLSSNAEPSNKVLCYSYTVILCYGIQSTEDRKDTAQHTECNSSDKP
ncbi:uncharacterized protein LOC134691528 [Mytilus trossulus]|uniref:uncharacterized protein LOC134691528 n=1 Tax=Mytilus trossulus TaxID=6551 RepID=UPI003004254C